MILLCFCKSKLLPTKFASSGDIWWRRRQSCNKFTEVVVHLFYFFTIVTTPDFVSIVQYGEHKQITNFEQMLGFFIQCKKQFFFIRNPAFQVLKARLFWAFVQLPVVEKITHRSLKCDTTLQGFLFSNHFSVQSFLFYHLLS